MAIDIRALDEVEAGYRRGFEQAGSTDPINTDADIEVWAGASETWKAAWARGWEDGNADRPHRYDS